MPRGGSKKGEHRGNAKGKGGRPEGTGGPNFTPRLGLSGTDKRRPVTPLSAEREERMRMLVGASDLLPKDVMLSAMRYFSDVANQYREVMTANLAAAAQVAAEPEKAAVYEGAAAQAEVRFLTYLRDACDVAYKVAPYCHARLMGVVNDPAANMAGTGFDMLRGILNEIAEHSRSSPMVIEHQPEQTLAEADR